MHGYSYASGKYTTIDYPGADSTGAYGINDLGEIVGGYCATTSPCGQSQIATQYGFLDVNGAFTKVNYPNAQGTQPMAINKAGVIVGVYDISNGGPHSFLYQNGQYRKIDFPGALSTHASAINNKGVVAGYYELPNSLVLGFIYDAGNFYTVEYPKTNDTGVAGINDKGIIVGVYAPPIGQKIPFKGVPNH